MKTESNNKSSDLIQDAVRRKMFPKALLMAAIHFKRNPSKVGEILVALTTGEGEGRMSELQRYILESCRFEMSSHVRAVMDPREAAKLRQRLCRERKRERALEEMEAK